MGSVQAMRLDFFSMENLFTYIRAGERGIERAFLCRFPLHFGTGGGFGGVGERGGLFALLASVFLLFFASLQFF